MSSPPNDTVASAEADAVVLHGVDDRMVVIRAVAHEFNNLLTTILGYATLVSRSLETGDTRRRDVDEIIHAVRRANPLVERLSAAASSEAGGSDPAASSATGGVARAERTRRVLVVEDETSVRFLVRTILRRIGCDVIDAAGPVEAKALMSADNCAIDLLVTDVDMPGGSGPTLYHELAAERPDVKVLFMSGHARDAVALDGPGASRAAFIQKPFGVDEFSRTVMEVLNR